MAPSAAPPQDPVDLYWERFLATLPAEDPRRFRDYIADAFGDNPALADDGSPTTGSYSTAIVYKLDS